MIRETTQRLAVLALAGWMAVAGEAIAQQVADLGYAPPVPKPAYTQGSGPRVVIDEAHHNFHTAAGRYRPFAELLRRDGYRVEAANAGFTVAALRDVTVLVIANPLHARNTEDWSLPTPSAFSPEEIAAVRTWVEQGGALFLIVDHMPFPGAAGDLAKAFGVEFSNGFAVAESSAPPASFQFRRGAGLNECGVTDGRDTPERVSSITTFVGSAFKPPAGAVAVLTLGPEAISLRPNKAWKFGAGTKRESIAGWCQGAVFPAGRGRVAVFGEAAMFSAQLAGPQKAPTGMNAPGAEGNHQLLLNILHWLTRLDGLPE